MSKINYTTIDEYIATCPVESQPILKQVWAAIKESAPKATEKISWAMPTFYQNGNLVHFALAKNHVGIYPGASGIENFKSEFEEMDYKYSKGAVQFPLNKPMPLELIKRIVEFRVEEQHENTD